MFVSGFTARFVGEVERDGHGMFHWEVKLSQGKREYKVDYYMGRGHATKSRIPGPNAVVNEGDGPVYLNPTRPELRGVLESLQVDCRSADHDTFEDFADEFGYDSDSRKAEAIYNACRKVRSEMRKLLGAEFDAFMNYDFDSET